MTFAKQNKVIALALALLMLVATVFIAAGSIITTFGVEEDTRNLQITFNSETCRLFYTVDGIEKEMVSGTAYAIPFGAQNVQIEVKPKDGYTLKGDGGIFTSEDFKPETQKLNGKETGETVYTIPRFNEDHVYYVRCVNRTFSIKFVPSLFAPGGTSIDYEFEGSAPNLSITYKTEGISIPTPKKVGHTFKGWTIVNKDGSEPGIAEITDGILSSEILTDDMLANDILYLRANFIKNKYDVTRYDFVYSETGFNNTGKQLGSYTWKVEMDTYLESVTAGGTADEGDKAALGYPGYEIRMGMTNPSTKCTVNVTGEAVKNELIRYYDPIVYLLKFDANGGVDVPDGEHTFNADTVLPATTRVGYTFNGWTVIVDGETVGTVTVNGDGKFVLVAEKKEYAANEIDQTTGKRVIKLRADWKANEYSINYGNVGADYVAPGKHIYDGATVIPDPVRKGYIFLGWHINGSTDLVKSENGSLALDPKQLPSDTTGKIEMVAVWEAKKFTVTLNANAGTDTVGSLDATVDTVFDSPVPNLTQVPTRVGYKFIGFATESGKMYINAEGKGIGNWEEDGVTVLYAQWEALPFTIIITCNNTDLIESVKINGVLYTPGEEYVIRFRETVAVEVVMKNGYKLISWMGGKQEHTAIFTTEYQHLIADAKTISFMVLPVIESPVFKIDYQTETLVTVDGAIPAGRYSIYDSQGTLWRTVLIDENGVISLNGAQATAISIPENFFGTTISIIRHGVDNVTADTDRIELPICARPAAPGIALEISPYHNDIIIKIITSADDKNVYQFAISRDRTGETLIWQDENIFSGLEPGTPYYVFVRVKHTADEPHSVPMSAIRTATTHGPYVLNTTERLNALRQNGDGVNIDAVIQNAKDAIARISENAPYDGYYADVEEVIANAKAAIPFARTKDHAINALRQKVDALIGTLAYDQTGIDNLENILADATEVISNATTPEDIQSASDSAEIEIDNVKVAYITTVDPTTNNTVQILGIGGGLSPDVKLTLSRYTDLETLESKIEAAIKAGNVIVYKSGITVASAIEALHTQDIMAAFKLAMVNGESLAERYEIRMPLPKDLVGVQGLCVGYYNEDTKKLEILDSYVDQDAIVFVTDQITDFIIFGDPTVSLTAAIAILGATLLLQIIAILFLLICRKKNTRRANTARTYAFAPVVALTIRFAPVNGLVIAVALAAAVVVTTVILIWLLLTTEIVRHDDRAEVADDAFTTAPNVDAVPYDAENTDASEEGAMSIFDEPQDDEGDPVLTTLTDVEIDGHPEDPEAVFHTPYAVEEQGYRFSYEADGEVTESEDAQSEEADPFAVYDEAEEGNYDFIEPAADPRYSLPDEELEDELFADPDDAFDSEEVLEEEASIEFEDDTEFVFEDDSEVLFADDTDVVYEADTAEDVTGEAYFEAPTEEGVSYEYTEQAPEYEQTSEVTFPEAPVAMTEEVVEEADEENEAILPAAEEQYDEEELGDIDDSYLADEESDEEELPDIDDSRLTE